MTAVLHQPVQRAAKQRSQVDLRQLPTAETADESADPFLMQSAEDPMDQADSKIEDPFMPGWRFKPLCGLAGQVGRLQLHANHVRMKEVLSDEVCEVLAYFVLAPRNYGRVGNRYPHRVAKQRHHCKPVSKGPHHAGL